MKSFDLNLCPWGPFNKKYLGISNVLDKKRGISFDFNLFPGFYRRSVLPPKDICDNGAKILKASGDLSHFLIRYELMWKDLVYIDADFKTDKNGEVMVGITAVNNTKENQSISLNGVASLGFPTLFRKKMNIMEYEGEGIWLDATDYSYINCTEKINNEGYKNGVRRIDSFVGGDAISLETFDKESYVSYKLNESITALMIRYQAKENVFVSLKVNEKVYSFVLEKTECPSLYTFVADEPFVEFELSAEGAGFIDGFVINDREPCFYDYSSCYTPSVKETEKSVTLDYKFASYEISWDYDDYVVRELIGSDMGTILTDSIHNHVNTVIHGEGKGHSVDIFIRPVFLKPNEIKSFFFKIKRLDKENTYPVNNEFLEIPINSDGEKYKLSMDIMSAVTLTNVAYPTYIKGEYIRHSTPGRLWDCLYTWDSGFIGMGLNALSKIRGEDCLSNYMTDESDPAPFILRGSVVPTQIFLFQEIWNSFTDKEFLKKFYPMLKRYYKFFTDNIDKETGLIKTWDYFYNSGGWDDYPPQFYVHENNLTKDVFPVITASVTILFAKVLKALGSLIEEDSYEFDEEIIKLKDALLKLWDEETGYFGYFDKSKNDILKYQGNVNFNMGFDGIYPYIADITDENQNEKIFDNIEKGLITEYGVSVVDKRAPYFSHKGYWNGSVWMPHQWVLWKSALDKGLSELSEKIAFTAMDLWKREVELTYNCYEHFMIENGRGSGFHQFSGLSTPVLLWYKAYFSPGNVSAGFFTTIDNLNWNNNFSEVSFDIVSTKENSDVLICLNGEYEYKVTVNGIEEPYKTITSGGILIKAKKGKVVINKKD